MVRVFNPQERERLGLEQSLDEFLLKSLPASSAKVSLQDNAFYQFIFNPLAYSPCNIEHWNTPVSLFNERIRAAEVSAVPHLHISMSSIMHNCKYFATTCIGSSLPWPCQHFYLSPYLRYYGYPIDHNQVQVVMLDLFSFYLN